MIDENRRVLGLIDPPAILRWRRAGKHRTTTLCDLLAGSKVTLAFPDEYLEGLSDKLLMANVSHLPVVTRESLQLVGYVGWKDLMRVRSRKQAEERDRSTLLGFGTRRGKKADAVEGV